MVEASGREVEERLVLAVGDLWLAVGDLCRQWQSPARARGWGLVAGGGSESLWMREEGWEGELQEEGWALQVW